uniref:Uncharacterized protein n=1 Tax=Rhizophagus irregularis (strain DAOM 181602 / DAOM 197198 / MUCL 43194) TaxID=747089 RepID=U9SPW3_RHIID
MNPTIITSKPIVIITSEVTEKPDGNPTNSCSIIFNQKIIPNDYSLRNGLELLFL